MKKQHPPHQDPPPAASMCVNVGFNVLERTSWTEFMAGYQKKIGNKTITCFRSERVVSKMPESRYMPRELRLWMLADSRGEKRPMNKKVLRQLNRLLKIRHENTEAREGKLPTPYEPIRLIAPARPENSPLE